MGLCKCPQRKVTNIFCYEHRVNVCEHCLTQNHPQCFVDTYRNWITDSVYSPTCALCEEELNKSETIRMLCLHIVHWDCLDAWARSLPLTTAPAGYTCPVCKKMGLFPPINQISPIADGLRNKMGQVNWARAGLGLPLLDREADPNPTKTLLNGNSNEFNHVSEYNGNHIPKDNFNPRSAGTAEVHSHSEFSQHNHQNNVGSTSGYAYQGHQNYSASPLPNSHYGSSDLVVGPALETSSSSRKAVPRTDFTTPLLMDEDDNKYRRRSAFESLSRWTKNFTSPPGRRTSRRKTALYIVISLIGVIVLFMLLFGRSSDSLDDTFNPQANPNVLIGHGKGIQHEAEVET